MTIRFDPEAAEILAVYRLVNLDGKDILEIGCGDGRFTFRYADKAASVLAIDPNADEIAKANAGLSEKMKSSVTFLASDVVTLDLQPTLYDLALFSWSM